MEVIAKANLIHRGQYIKKGDKFDVPPAEANSLLGVELTEDPLKATEFASLLKAINEAKTGKGVNLNPIKSDLINGYAVLIGIPTDGRSKADVFSDIVEEVKKDGSAGSAKS